MLIDDLREEWPMFDLLMRSEEFAKGMREARIWETRIAYRLGVEAARTGQVNEEEMKAAKQVTREMRKKVEGLVSIQ